MRFDSSKRALSRFYFLWRSKVLRVLVISCCCFGAEWGRAETWIDDESDNGFVWDLAAELEFELSQKKQYQPGWLGALADESQDVLELVAFLGVHRTGDFVDFDDELNGGLQTGFRAEMEILHEDQGVEFVLSHFGGQRRDPVGPQGLGFPDSTYRTSLFNGELNLVSRETIGEHQRTTVLGFRALSTSEDLDSYGSVVSTISSLSSGATITHGATVPHPQTLDTRLLALQLGWEKSVSNRRFEYRYGLRTALGVGHHAYMAVRQTDLISNSNRVYETFETSDFDLGSVAEYYWSASYRFNERSSLTAGLYRLSLVSFDNPSEAVSGERLLVRHFMGVHFGANYAF